MNYLSFVLREKRILTFGLSFTFFSSFGQTFLISLFVPYFLKDFNLSNAGFGSLYSVATLGSAAILPYLGRLIDHLPLKQYGMYVAIGLLTASVTLALSWHVALLFVALLLLRLSGQGLSSHTAQTAMARYFIHERGKALSISSLGYPMGEGIFPLIVAGMLSILSWRMTWAAFAVVIALLFIPFIQLVLNESHTSRLDELKNGDTDSGDSKKFYQRILSDSQFWLLVPAVLLPAFWATALFLYQISIAEQLGWTSGLLATAFVAFAGTRIVSSLGVGPLIDRWSADTLFPFYLLPFGAGLMIAWFHPGSWSAFLYMGLLGVTMGMGSNIKSALWAELYGEKVIGTVRSLFSSLMVFSTALSPFMIGWLLDHEVAMTTILVGAIGSILLATILAFMAFKNE
ncbi:Predicted arabinose efflux permease, MFS family [Fodinibius roseus]|uniref:Predicted arabinose efflux permease, MFS family n=1 Tax=Fodinibius roseus TaxID=1194090 RepID=A0A1M5CB58_9BACT|nr:MFS transporter [Fodinibius roseus]SHF51827.1 Predicted arabinose efflux permease, MFS family [Fodinibius roseus]